ncbi:MAG: site-2 protease family protein [Leptospirales bacterium]
MGASIRANFTFLVKSIQEYPSENRQNRLMFFLLTLLSMTLTYGAFINGTWDSRLINGFIYSSCLMLILLSHEFGHFFQAKKYGVECTLPFFIPLPFVSPFGTMGAFIRMKTSPSTLNALFDISFWGPAMSFFLSLPVLVIGLYLSEIIPSEYENSLFIAKESPLLFGPSFLISTLQKILLDIPAGHALVMHPMAYAGWVGLFVTAINLIPVGQLDGGHIAYAFLGKTQIYIAYVFLVLLLLLAAEFTPAWLFWVILLFILGIRHPVMKIKKIDSMRSKNIHTDRKRLMMGILSAFIFCISFIPAPITVAGAKELKEEQEVLPGEDWQYNIHYEKNEEKPVDGNHLFN